MKSRIGKAVVVVEVVTMAISNLKSERLDATFSMSSFIGFIIPIQMHR